MINNKSKSQVGDVIVALDKMEVGGDRGIQSVINSVTTGSEELVKRTVFKVNDLLAYLGLRGMNEFVFNMRQDGINTSKINWMFDPKWNDIPNTIANYFEKLKQANIDNVRYVTIMASGGAKMMKKAVETRNKLKMTTKILAVTVLTTMEDKDSRGVFNEEVKHEVLKLAKLALESGVDGIVCSPREAEMLREVFGEKYPDFEIVTPGIRMKDAEVSGDDQKRTKTPSEAIEGGSSHLVVGRPIIQSENRIATIEEIIAQIDSAEFTPNEIPKYAFEKVLYTGTWEQLIKFIGAIYNRPEGGKYVRLASKLLSDGYVNIGATERNFRVLERASEELANKLNENLEKLLKPIGNFIQNSAKTHAKNYEKGLKEIEKKYKGLEKQIFTDIFKKQYVEIFANIENDLENSRNLITPHVVMGAQMGSVRLSAFLAKSMGIEESVYTEKDGDDMILKRHDIDLKGKNVILSEDVITKGSTLVKMIKLVNEAGGKVIGITCVVNRSGKDNYEGIPITSCYIPEKFGMYYDGMSVRKIFEEILENSGFNELVIQESMGAFPENIFGYKNDNITTRRNLLLIFEKIRNEFYRNELIKITNIVFDKFEKDGILPLPEGVKVEESPKANWPELTEDAK